VPASTADSSVRVVGSGGSAVDQPVVPMASQQIVSSRDVSTGRPFASHLMSDVQSRRREIRLGKRPLEEAPAAVVAGNSLFLFSPAFTFPCLCNIMYYVLVMQCISDENIQVLCKMIQQSKHMQLIYLSTAFYYSRT
jgi:hypothetical protein